MTDNSRARANHDGDISWDSKEKQLEIHPSYGNVYSRDIHFKINPVNLPVDLPKSWVTGIKSSLTEKSAFFYGQMHMNQKKLPRLILKSRCLCAKCASFTHFLLDKCMFLRQIPL